MKTSCHSRGLVEYMKRGIQHLTEFNKKLGGLFWLKCGAALLHEMSSKGLDSVLQ